MVIPFTLNNIHSLNLSKNNNINKTHIVVPNLNYYYIYNELYKNFNKINIHTSNSLNILNEFDIFHDPTRNFIYTLNILRKKMSLNVPITVQTHGLGYNHHDINYTLDLIEGFQPYDCIICTSSAAKKAVDTMYELTLKSLKKKGLKNINIPSSIIIPLGIDPDNLPIIDKNIARHQLKIENCKIVLLYFGRVTPFDKADLIPFIKSFKELINSNKLLKNRLLLLIAGNDLYDYGSKLYSYIEQNNLNNNITLLINSKIKREILYSASRQPSLKIRI